MSRLISDNLCESFNRTIELITKHYEIKHTILHVPEIALMFIGKVVHVFVKGKLVETASIKQIIEVINKAEKYGAIYNA